MGQKGKALMREKGKRTEGEKKRTEGEKGK